MLKLILRPYIWASELASPASSSTPPFNIRSISFTAILAVLICGGMTKRRGAHSAIICSQVIVYPICIIRNFNRDIAVGRMLWGHQDRRYGSSDSST